AIGDIVAQFAEFALHMSQPFPGETESQTEKRFLIYQVSETEHVIMDNLTADDVVIPSEYLRNPAFTFGLWYAQKR
ncbi:hypothetical protein DFH08DRAFT_642493, partial [Mycena albidolilacea]